MHGSKSKTNPEVLLFFLKMSAKVMERTLRVDTVGLSLPDVVMLPLRG